MNVIIQILCHTIPIQAHYLQPLISPMVASAVNPEQLKIRRFTRSKIIGEQYLKFKTVRCGQNSVNCC